MQRVTISIDEPLAAVFDQFLQARDYQNRSEAVRDLVRNAVTDWRDEHEGRTHCVADLSYVYDRQTRALAQRLTDMQHANHDLVISTHLVRLDHRHSLESVFLKGSHTKVRAFAAQVLAERGVRFGKINLIGVDLNDTHAHTHDHHHEGLAHLHPPEG